MRSRVLLPGLLACASAFAAPSTSASWADWTGTYRGTLTWSSCTAPGSRTPTLAIEFTDGVASIDLAPARSTMPTLSLVGDDKGYSARQADLAVAIARPKVDTIDLAIDLDSGCIARGRLTREATAVPACTTLVAWARIEARCTKTTATEDFGKLVATKWKPADAASCATRAAKLERSLIDAGCAPHPDPLIGVRAKDCLLLSQSAAKLARCANIPQQLKTEITSAAHALNAAAQSAEKATLPYVEQQCRDTSSTITAIATRFSCPL